MNKEQQQVSAQAVPQVFSSLKQELAKVIVGHDQLIKELFICILCQGHALIEGVPGLGKTLLVQTIGKILCLDYSRIQFTPDLMPADILGTQFITTDETGGRSFKFYKGPIFGQIILADEINRATPKTQSALLEAMQEKQVTIFGEKHLLDPPFVVLATQNPLEMEGTYPLPEAQVDRFMFKLKMMSPGYDDLIKILDLAGKLSGPAVEPLLDASSLQQLLPSVLDVPVAEHVKEYAVRLLMGTHPSQDQDIKEVSTFVRYGASPRGLQAMVTAARAYALLDGRFNVSIDDIMAMAKPALRHRIILNLKGIAEGVNTDDIITRIAVAMKN